MDCPKAAVTVGVELNLGGGDDVASVAASVKLPVIFDGGSGNDGLFGGGGLDTFDGGPGNDNIVARDNRAESVECASGIDTAITDDADMRVSCEEVEGDADGDGVRRPRDCDDTKPQIRPGVADFPDDGSTRTARAPTRPTSTATRTASRARRTATTATQRSSPARARCRATPSTRTATARSSRSRRSPAPSRTPG